MGLLDPFLNLLGLSPPSLGEGVSFEDLVKLIGLATDTNRINQQGLFTGYEWDADKTTQTQTVNPALEGLIQAMIDRLSNRQTVDRDPRYGEMRDALLGRFMNRHGLPSQGTPVDSSLPGAPPAPPQLPPNRVPWTPPVSNPPAQAAPGGPPGRGDPPPWRGDPYRRRQWP